MKSPVSDKLQSPEAIDAVWCAWCELNRIRARDGAPDGVCPNYFNELVDSLKNMLPKKFQNPWHPRYVRAKESEGERKMKSNPIRVLMRISHLSRGLLMTCLAFILSTAWHYIPLKLFDIPFFVSLISVFIQVVIFAIGISSIGMYVLDIVREELKK